MSTKVPEMVAMSNQVDVTKIQTYKKCEIEHISYGMYRVLFYNKLKKHTKVRLYVSITDDDLLKIRSMNDNLLNDCDIVTRIFKLISFTILQNCGLKGYMALEIKCKKQVEIVDDFFKRLGEISNLNFTLVKLDKNQ